VTLALSVAAFGGGAWLLVESVEGLVKALTGWAAAAGLSGLALSALVLGFDVESTGAGVAATLDRLPGTALGTSVGAAVFLVTIGVGLAAVVAPFSVRTPRPMLLAAAVATALPVALLADGTLSRLDGAVLVAAFVPLVAVVALSARRAGQAPESDAERPRRLWLRLLAGLAGLVVGAEVLVFGTRGIVDGLGVSETAFGLLVVAAAVSFEEVVLEMLPAHRVHPEISVGNAIGTLLFLLTGSLGVIALVRPIVVPGAVTSFHDPALVLVVALLLGLLLRGRLGRPEGAVLVAAYGAYVGGALVLS
jgi:cation:H+ antiporter